MNLDFDNNVPIYLQIVKQIKIEIISGNLTSGSRIASVRELANKMKVNPNTMQKALTELENISLIYTERTNGKFVTEDKNLIEKMRDEYANDITKKYLNNMHNLGFNGEDTVEYLNRLRRKA